MKVVHSEREDFAVWLNLAREVEHLFGPMVEEESFRTALRTAIDEGNALCIKGEDPDGTPVLYGGVVIAPASSEIVWLTVSENCRRQGAGAMLLTYALKCLNHADSINLVTFADSVREGLPARQLYLKFGFTERESMGKNPAGFPVVSMVYSGCSSSF